MKKAFVGVLVLATLIPVLAMGFTLGRTRSFAGVTLPNGDNPLPANGINIPNRAIFAEVILTRDNWPVDGVDLSIEVSFDGGANWVVCAGPTHIAQGTFNPKLGKIPDANIGCGWNADRQHPDTGRMRTNNPDAGFTSDVTVNFYVE